MPIFSRPDVVGYLSQYADSVAPIPPLSISWSIAIASSSDRGYQESALSSWPIWIGEGRELIDRVTTDLEQLSNGLLMVFNQFFFVGFATHFEVTIISMADYRTFLLLLDFCC